MFALLPAGARETKTNCTLVGRIGAIREASSKLVFYTLSPSGDPSVSVQVLADSQYFTNSDTFGQLSANVKRGDYVSITGFPGKSNRGELSLIPTSIQTLAPSIHPPPETFSDPNLKYRQRYLDLLHDSARVRRAVAARNHVYHCIRSVLDEDEFMEVETPMLHWMAGGANARPFKTAMDSFGRDHLHMELRIAPELYLKQLVIGGLERVYEIGRQFRNEGADATHNPEFTTCEFYKAHADAEDMAALCERIVRKALNLEPNAQFNRLEFVPTIEHATGETMPDLNDESAVVAYAKKYDALPSSQPYTLPRVLDALCGKFVEPLCSKDGCTFITDHPIALSPLAREHPDPIKRARGLSHRFELFLGGKEIANGYSELNKPEEQQARFDAQKEQQKRGDGEARTGADDDFVRALEYGLPPTGGCGIGVDRLVMWICGERHIRDVLLFPLMRPKEN
jgi:lysyl-tRNA synthetase class 2